MPAYPPEPHDPQDWATEPDDAVEHPAHYTSHPSGVECITVTEHMGFNLGNALKYLWRADLKGDADEDLRKARWCVDREIARRAEVSNVPQRWTTPFDAPPIVPTPTFAEQPDEDAPVRLTVWDTAEHVMEMVNTGTAGIYAARCRCGEWDDTAVYVHELAGRWAQHGYEASAEDAPVAGGE